MNAKSVRQATRQGSWSCPIAMTVGEVVQRDGFAYADVVPAG